MTDRTGVYVALILILVTATGYILVEQHQTIMRVNRRNENLSLFLEESHNSNYRLLKQKWKLQMLLYKISRKYSLNVTIPFGFIEPNSTVTLDKFHVEGLRNEGIGYGRVLIFNSTNEHGIDIGVGRGD